MTTQVDIVGQRFGRYLVIAKSDKRTKAMKQMVLCKCDCGTEREVVAGNLRSGLTNSCGCWKDEKTSARMKKHGFSKNTMYMRYRSMIKRCYEKTHKEYANYGGRGITVCSRWLDSVENYIEDMGFPPFKDASIDRIDNNLGYSKENCRWATKKEQSENRRATTMVNMNGENLCLSDWSKKLGLNKQSVARRIKAGWSVEMAITMKKHTKIKHIK